MEKLTRVLKSRFEQAEEKNQQFLKDRSIKIIV